MAVLGIALAALIGLSLGLLGGGGSILTVPIFVYVLGFPAKPAIAMTLPVVGVTSLAGAITHWRAGNVELKTALLFGPVTMVAAFGGARLSAYLSGALQLAILAIVMLAVAVSMLRPARGGAPAANGAHGRRPSLVILAGLGVGILTGLVGTGGGFLIVPALVLLAGVPMKHAVGTSLAVITMTTTAGFAGYADQVDIPFGFVALFTAVAVVGSLTGALLVRHISTAALRRIFAVFLLVMGVFMLYENGTALIGGDDARAAASRP